MTSERRNVMRLGVRWNQSPFERTCTERGGRTGPGEQWDKGWACVLGRLEVVSTCPHARGLRWSSVVPVGSHSKSRVYFARAGEGPSTILMRNGRKIRKKGGDGTVGEMVSPSFEDPGSCIVFFFSSRQDPKRPDGLGCLKRREGFNIEDRQIGDRLGGWRFVEPSKVLLRRETTEHASVVLNSNSQNGSLQSQAKH